MQAEADIVRFVSRLPLLRGFSADGRQRLIDASQLMPLRSGELLYDQRTDPEYLYLVVNGRVRAEHFDHDEVTVRREIGRGESVGGMSILSARPHKARVRAIRDTRVLRIPAEAFLALFDAEPAAGRAVLNRWLNRFMESRSEERVRLSIGSLRTVAVVGAHDGAPVEAVARGLGAAFARFNLCLRLDRRLAEQRSGLRLDGDVEGPDAAAISYWLNEQERRHRYMVLQADDQGGQWTERCLRQADRVIVVADSAAAVRPGGITRRLKGRTQHSEVELAIVGPEASQPLAWRDLSGGVMHHRLRRCESAEMDRLARLLSGRAVGVALGGGGARGFAHIGLLQALERFEIPVDIIYGTSMGAFIGGLAATGRSVDEVREAAFDMWVHRSLLNDYTVPRVSLIKARKARSYLERLFAGIRIEDLPLQYGCVSTNISKGTAAVHDRGLLAHWIGTSMSIPGIAPPVVFRGDLLVDGGIAAPVPVEQVAALARGPIIASDVTSEENFRGVDGDSEEPEQLPRRRTPEDTNIFQILYRTATLSTPEDFKRRRQMADCYLRMPVSGIGMFNWDKADAVIDASRDYACRKLERWLAEHQARG